MPKRKETTKPAYSNRTKSQLDLKRRMASDLTMIDVWTVCGKSGVDPRTFKKFWTGELVQAGVALRLDHVLCEAGLLEPEKKTNHGRKLLAMSDR